MAQNAFGGWVRAFLEPDKLFTEHDPAKTATGRVRRRARGRQHSDLTA
jgi:hypothetical protein